MSSDQKVVVITGASRGIGASLMRGFREIGYGVVVDGDISEPNTAERIVSAAIERFGRIDTLINNAGVFIPKPFIDYSEADFLTMTAVNLAGFFHISQKTLPWMLRAGSGHI